MPDGRLSIFDESVSGALFLLTLLVASGFRKKYRELPIRALGYELQQSLPIAVGTTKKIN
jgi:hypothetical protein